MSTEDATSAKLEAALATLKEHDETLRDLVSALRGVMGEDGLLRRVAGIDARLALVEADRMKAKAVIAFVGMTSGAFGVVVAMAIDYLKKQ